MVDVAVLQARLAEAEAAFHKLSTGSATAQVVYESGDVKRSYTYTKTDLDKLAAYIAQLRSDLADDLGLPVTRRRPLHFGF